MEVEDPILPENFPHCNPSDISLSCFDDIADLSDFNFDIFDNLDLDIDLDLDLNPNDSPLNSVDSKSNSPNANLTTSSKPESPKSNISCNNKRKIDDVDNPHLSNSDHNNEEKRKERLLRNRESAHLSRQKKKQYVEELEQKVKVLTSTITDLNGKLSYYMADNVRLRSLVNGTAGKNSNHDVIHPPPPLLPMPYHYPWIPYIPYPVKPNSIPIPRLNKEDSKRSYRKRKKLASVSSMGLFLLAMLVIGGVTNFGLSENKEKDGRDGKVLNVNGLDHGLMNRFNSSNSNKTVEFGNVPKMYSEVMSGLGDKSGESLPALLYVQRNGKHVEVNGNLIIQSVLASERAIADENLGLKREENSLAIANPMGSMLVLSQSKNPRGCGNIKEHMKALPSGSHGTYMDDVKPTLADKYLHQWFLESYAGPGLSTATCTELFQFNVSPSTSVLNNATNKLPPSNFKNRKMGQPIPLNRTRLDSNKPQKIEKSTASNITVHSRTSSSSSSVVVSVLFDPKEVNDADRDGVITSNYLSRIFVVVLVDSVKYITYSCMLPLKSSVPRVVN